MVNRNHLLYFGREMVFTDNNGEMHEASFWKPEHFSINTADQILYVQFVAYKSKDDFDAGGESLLKLGGSWTKTYTGEAYKKLILLFAEAVAGVALATWQIADAVKDTPNEAGTFESFFAGASEIVAPEEMQSFFNSNSGDKK